MKTLRYTWVLLLLGMCTFAYADKAWIDITDQYIQSPSFKNNSNQGWTWESNAQSQTVRCEAMEFWNGTFNIHQTIPSLKAGQYRLSCSAYWRCQEEGFWTYYQYAQGEEDITAYLYAGDNQIPLKSIFTFHFLEYKDGTWHTNWDGSDMYFPNSMETGTEAFRQGAYFNQMEFTHDGGDLTIGLIDEVFTKGNWCLFDDFKLEVWDEVVYPTSVTLNTTSLDIIAGETATITATFLPENTTFKKLEWSSSNESVATVDNNGLVTGVNSGTCTLTGITTDGSNKKVTVSVIVTANHATSSSLIINEVMVSNVDQFASPAYNFDAWVELYNPTNRPVDINNIYLSNDNMNRRLWLTPTDMGIIPAKGYKLVWFDSNTECHTNAPFKLDVDGGAIYISNGGGQLITSFVFPAGKERVSYARTTDGGDTWGFTDQPTPGASNSSSAFATTQLMAPVVSEPSQLFTGELTTSVEIPEGVTLRYTTDGTLPTLTNGEVSTDGYFSFTGTTNLRLRFFQEGMLASPVTSRSFIYNYDDKDFSGLPIVAIVADPSFLYSNEMGVMVRGTNGRPGNGQSTACNWNMDWERPVNFSFIKDGEMVFNQDVNLEMAGGWSRAWSPHSFKLKGTKEMGGNKNLNYPFFSQKPYIRNRTLQMRNGGNDTQCRFKDAALQTIALSSGIDLDGQSYEPTHQFINGNYIGVINMREPNNKHYVYANYGWDDDEIDQFEMSPDSGYVQKCGTYDMMEYTLNLSYDAANDDTYEELRQLIDMDEYINYMAMEMYLGSNDWPQNNIKGFRLIDGGRMRLVAYDLDGALATTSPFYTFAGKETKEFDQLYPVELGRITKDIELVRLFINLLNNDKFRRQFIDTYCIIGGSVYESERVKEILDELYYRVEPEMQINGESPYNTYRNLRSSLSNRCTTMMQAMKDYSPMKLSSTTAQTATLQSGVEGADIMVNDVKVPTGYFNGQLFAPVTISVREPAGYRFRGWIDNKGVLDQLFDYGANWAYYDQGSLDGTTWNAIQYNTSKWKNGNAPFGYGKDGITTTLSYGDDSNQKRPTYYFRKTFTLSTAPNADDQFTINFTIDDGAIIYINGKEAGRYNMPSGTVTYDTYSTTYAPNNPDQGTLTFPGSLFRKGNNVVAVEVHNNSATSTDIMWDAEMGGVSASENFYSTDAEITMPTNAFSLTASFEELSEAEREQAGINPVRINEVSAANSTFVNEYGKKNDWVELYNTTNEDIDIEGWYLSDNLAKPTKYQISKEQTNANTIIPAHGHLIIWCDKLNTDQQLHASFKLSADGGTVTLMPSNQAWTDTLPYPAHDMNVTVGRYPDGAYDVYTLTKATIGKQNILSQYAEVVDQEMLTGIDSPAVDASSEVSIRFVAQGLAIHTDDAAHATITIYTADGKQVVSNGVTLHNGSAYVGVSQLQSGFYIARLTDAHGHTASCKFTK